MELLVRAKFNAREAEKTNIIAKEQKTATYITLTLGLIMNVMMRLTIM